MAIAYGAVAGLIRIWILDYTFNKTARPLSDELKK
jgi:hypothetical protein